MSCVAQVPRKAHGGKFKKQRMLQQQQNGKLEHVAQQPGGRSGQHSRPRNNQGGKKNDKGGKKNAKQDQRQGASGKFKPRGGVHKK